MTSAPLPVSVDRADGLPLSTQLSTQVRDLILGETLRRGDRLPGSRALAADLSVSRSVTEQAYVQLLAEGWLETRHGAGTFVASGGMIVATPRPRTTAPPDRLLVRLDTGTPWIDPRHSAGWRRAWREVSSATPPRGYDDPRGLPDLRAAIAERLARTRGLVVEPDEVIITGGTTDGLRGAAEGRSRRAGDDHLPWPSRGGADPGACPGSHADLEGGTHPAIAARAGRSRAPAAARRVGRGHHRRPGPDPVLTPPARGLLDTSVFIALESDRPLNAAMLPDQSIICPVTIAELQAGVLAATDVDIRARRLATLESTGDIELLTIDAAVAAEWARLCVYLAETRRRVNTNDLWIAATAAAHGIPVVTQDNDFAPLVGATGFEAIVV